MLQNVIKVLTKYGYLFAIALMILCSGLTIWFFRFKKWL